MKLGIMDQNINKMNVGIEMTLYSNPQVVLISIIFLKLNIIIYFYYIKINYFF